MYNRILFVGAGIIGGSYIKRIQAVYPETQLEVLEKDPYTRDLLKKASIKVYDSLQACSGPYDILWICLPESKSLEIFERLEPELLHENSMIIDCCSSKAMIKSCISNLGLEKYHKSIHPIFGSEKRGYVHSDGTKVIGSTCIICDDDHKDSFYDFLKTLGHQVVSLETQAHDRYYALTSHLTHIFALVQNSMIDEPNKAIVPPSFKTLKRLSDMDPLLWTEILWHNKEALVDIIEKTQENLEAVRLSLLKDSKDVFEVLQGFKSLGGINNGSKEEV